MNNYDVDQNNAPLAPEDEYEPPAVVDFGTVFTTTLGSASGSTDVGGQRS